MAHDETAEDLLDAPDLEASEDHKTHVKKEMEHTRDFVSGISLDDLKSGDWFLKLLSFSLAQYVREVNGDYFREKYPHLPPDAIVDKRIALAASNAAIEGGLSSTAYTGLVAATIGSGGAASPLALPAGGASFVVDLSYVSYLQLRMAYDISVLYGIPLDLHDPEDTMKLVRLAFGIKAGEVAGNGVTKGVPMVVQPVVKKVFSGPTLNALKSLPGVGKYLLQRNIVKFSIPGVSIPLSSGVNFWTTKVAGRNAKAMLRKEARIIEASRRLVARATDIETFLLTMWWIMGADQCARNEEALFLHNMTIAAEQDGIHGEEYSHFLDGFEHQVELDERDLWQRINRLPTSDAPTLFHVAILAAVIDGKCSKVELGRLKILADELGQDYDDKVIDDIRKKWK